MTINEAITAVIHASHIDDQSFRQFLCGDDPEVVAMRAALVQLADAVRGEYDKPLHDWCSDSACRICNDRSRAMNVM